MKFSLQIFVIILLFVSAGYSYGGNKFFRGYVITLNNDTLHGYINYNNKKITPDQVLFKETLDGSDMVFTPKSISEFRSAGEVFRSAIVKINQSQIKKSELTLSPDFQLIIDTVFLQVIILGNKELYYLKDSLGKESFYINQDSEYSWLMYKKYLRNENGKTLTVSNNSYIGQLLIYLRNCKSINPVLSEAAYNYNDLLKVFFYYYNCTNTRMVYLAGEEKQNFIKRLLTKKQSNKKLTQN